MLFGACRTAEGRKCRLGEGGFGIVYKAVMNGVDEVAVKLVKVRTYTARTFKAGLCVSHCLRQLLQCKVHSP
jgi:hypothetical protein